MAGAVLTNIDEQTQSNLAMVEFETIETTPKIYRTTRIEELAYSAVISEGGEVVHRNKNEILGIDKKEDIQYGSDLSAKHLVFSPQIFALIDGGTLVMDTVETTKVIGYNPPTTGAVVNRTKFKVRAYSEIKDGADTTAYYCIEFTKCKGKPISFTFKDGEFFVSQYNITSRPGKTEVPYSIKKITALPV